MGPAVHKTDEMTRNCRAAGTGVEGARISGCPALKDLRAASDTVIRIGSAIGPRVTNLLGFAILAVGAVVPLWTARAVLEVVVHMLSKTNSQP